MCGIAGFVDPRGSLERRVLLTTLGDALAHRGPDGDGFFEHGAFGLAHRRLAIIDLSPGAAQPMQIGSVAVVFNGEIYNYLELRSELIQLGHTFNGVSDTEVLGRAYLNWGSRCVERLRGMWAFAIVDLRTNVLLCARDPFGIKPFYYIQHRGCFIFASEPQALLRAGFPARADENLVAQYLALGVTDHTRGTFFAGIRQLGAGETLTVRNDGSMESVSGPDIGTGGPASGADLAATLTESVRLHLRSDVPVGTCLSGGLDSSTVAALASRMANAAGARAFAAVTAISEDPRTDESPFAEAVVRHCGLEWHTVRPTAEEFVHDVDNCIRVQNEPVLSPSAYFQFRVMGRARAAGLKVMLDGQGGDETLCGYERYVPTWALARARAIGPTAALTGFVSAARKSRYGVLGMARLAAYVLLPRVRGAVVARRIGYLKAEARTAALDVVASIAATSGSLQEARLADIRFFSLPALLRYEDRNSMAHSIEARVPYVDREVVRCSLSMPDAGLIQDGFSKYPLRQVAAKCLPPEIAWRRAKIGFEPPTTRWLAALGTRMEADIARSSLVAALCTELPAINSLPPPLRWRMFNLARWQELFQVAAG